MGRLLTAEILSIGSEITVGETRDTNAGDLARSLTEMGVGVSRMTALPDSLAEVSSTFTTALGRSDLVVSTGGLGPTPDDLTREAVASAVGEEPQPDPDLERWLRDLWSRRGLEFPAMNLKQAWLLPSSTSIPNANGTAPGWWVDRPDGRLVVVLPGPPREMWPMWQDWVLPRLRARGIGRRAVVRTLRLAGIGESQVAELLGEELLRTPNPVVATYARAEAVDVRISAIDDPSGRDAATLAAAAEGHVISRLGQYVWATGETTWAEAVSTALETHGWRLAISESGLRGALVELLDELAPPVVLGEVLDRPVRGPLGEAAERVRSAAGADVGLAVAIRTRGADTTVSVAVASPDGPRDERRIAFLGGSQGRRRAALVAAEVLLRALRGGAAVSGGPAVSGAMPGPGPRGRSRR